MVHTIAMIDDAPTVLRYPRGTGYGDVEMPEKPEFLTPGKGRIVRQGEGSLAILSVGTRLRESLSAAERLEGFGISATVADARWVKPVDEDLIKELAAKHRVLITIEENSIGGFAAMVTDVLLEEGCLDGIGEAPLVYRSMFLPDRYIDADEPVKQYEEAELNAENIMTQAIAALQRARVKVLSPSKMLEMLEQVEEGSV